MKKQKSRNQQGITLIALVVTIIVLIILAGVSINIVLGENGIITMAKRAKENMEIAAEEEQIALDNLYMQMSDTAAYNEEKKVNAPMLLTGMSAIKFTDPTETAMGEVVKTNSNDEDWYDYEDKKWANTQTQDGSMWVWIPRYAYKITYYTDENKTTVSSTKTNYGSVDVKFLIGTTDTYYKEDGSIATAQRQTKIDETIDTTSDYTVHPAFTNESKINYANGGWDKELTGIWVAKFEAGYASGNNTAEVKASKVNYNNYNNIVYANATERETADNEDGNISERNWLDGIYAGTTTSIKYPTFQGTTYAMNYINQNDSYNIAKALIDSGNIYGFSKANADSHLMKNSEWGAVAYLSKSNYGINETEMTTNNINLNSGGSSLAKAEGNTLASVYAVTGCSSNNTNKANVKTTITALNGVSGNTGVAAKASDNSDVEVYVWNQLTGTKASTTGTIYGIYDISGGTWERTASYIANGNTKLQRYGESIAYENNTLKTASTKYTTVYPYSSPESSVVDTASQTNFANNTKIYGDSIRETTSSKAGTAESGWNTSSWNSDYSIFAGWYYPFFIRGGRCWNGSSAGAFAFYRNDGGSSYNYGFRAVVVPLV